MNIKVPSNQAEMDALRNDLARMKLDEDDLDSVVGGNDDLKGKDKIEWTCFWCGKTIKLKSEKDAAKHMAKNCPKNPYK